MSFPLTLTVVSWGLHPELVAQLSMTQVSEDESDVRCTMAPSIKNTLAFCPYSLWSHFSVMPSKVESSTAKSESDTTWRSSTTERSQAGRVPVGSVPLGIEPPVA